MGIWLRVGLVLKHLERVGPVSLGGLNGIFLRKNANRFEGQICFLVQVCNSGDTGETPVFTGCLSIAPGGTIAI